MAKRQKVRAGKKVLAGKKLVDNHPAAERAKIKLRGLVKAALRAEGRPIHVFDGFAGSGVMYRGAWQDADSYVGCDERWFPDERLAYVADNRRVLRAIDLSPFTVFDLDAYGAPWEQTLILAARRPVAPGELIGLILTDGGGIGYKMNALGDAVRLLAGLRKRQGAGQGVIQGLGRQTDVLIDRVLTGLAERMQVKIERRWEAHGKTASGMRYIGLLLRGVETPSP